MSSEIKRRFYKAVREIVQSEIPDCVKLARCVNESNLYAALTGDDSLTPPGIIAMRKNMMDPLPAMMLNAKRAQKDNQQGQSFMKL